MKSLIILPALVACALAGAISTADEQFITLQEYNAGLEADKDRIVGGAAAAAGQFPWQVAVQYRTNSGNFFCGGSLIDPQWVLTAAHCAVGAIQFTLYLGGLTLSNSENGRITVLSTDYIVHEGYSSNNLNNDIALVRLPSPVSLNDRIQTIRLPLRGQVTADGTPVTVSGWGRTSDSATGVSNILNFVDLTTISNTQCAAVYGSSVIISSTICAVGNPFHSTCNGDSGGPLVIYDGQVATQVGVVSFVHRAGCASGNPSGYVRTEAQLSWISEKTGINFG